MKVLMLSWEYPPHVVGGMGKHVIELVPELLADGVEIHLVVPRLDGGEVSEPLILPDGTPAGNGSRVYRVEPSTAQGDFFAKTYHDNIPLCEFATHLVEEQGGFDVIHNHDWLSSFAAINLKDEFHLPLLTTVHATEMGRTQGNLYGSLQQAIHQAEWRAIYESWRLIACSRYMSWEIQHYFGVPAEKIEVIPNGVDPRRFDALNGKDLSEFRLQFAQPDQPIIYYVGRIVPEKGLSVLVDSVPLVLREWPEAKFVIAGGGGYVEELRAKARALGVQDSIIFPGRVPDEVRDGLFKVANVAVFPSLYEPFGIVALEAMSAGTPVVVAEVGGLQEVVELHRTGITVKPNDPQSLAWGILHTLANPEWAATRASNASCVARAEFNWARIADQTSRVYHGVVEEAYASDWAYKVPMGSTTT
ncbi:MAG: glycosyltransferase family 4 protein [Chloroflexota bacterium]|nr:glycosyltransferase family 4 protein [Chloroflexota bacterium]